jgi:hypothetical protein
MSAFTGKFRRASRSEMRVISLCDNFLGNDVSRANAISAAKRWPERRATGITHLDDEYYSGVHGCAVSCKRHNAVVTYVLPCGCWRNGHNAQSGCAAVAFDANRRLVIVLTGPTRRP